MRWVHANRLAKEDVPAKIAELIRLWIKQISPKRARAGLGNGGGTMPLPFLHKFLASDRGSKFELQPQREKATHSWALSLIGPDGPQLLEFEIMGLGDAAPRKAGIFIYARKRSGEWQPLYIGESANLQSRLAFNEIAADALLSGATDIHILKLAADAKTRRDLSDRLILTNRPPLNEEERMKLETLAGDRLAKPAKGRSRAA